MKSLIIGAMALSLLAAGAASGQPMGPGPQSLPVQADRDHLGGDHHGGERHDRRHHHRGRRVCIWRHHHQICYWRYR